MKGGEAGVFEEAACTLKQSLSPAHLSENEVWKGGVTGVYF